MSDRIVTYIYGRIGQRLLMLGLARGNVDVQMQEFRDNGYGDVFASSIIHHYAVLRSEMQK